MSVSTAADMGPAATDGDVPLDVWLETIHATFLLGARMTQIRVLLEVKAQMTHLSDSDEFIMQIVDEALGDRP